jgi:hypothetical protein
MQGYFASFIKTGNPNGLGLPSWPTYGGSGGFPIMRLDVESRAEPEKTRACACSSIRSTPSLSSAEVAVARARDP